MTKIERPNVLGVDFPSPSIGRLRAHVARQIHGEKTRQALITDVLQSTTKEESMMNPKIKAPQLPTSSEISLAQEIAFCKLRKQLGGCPESAITHLSNTYVRTLKL